MATSQTAPEASARVQPLPAGLLTLVSPLVGFLYLGWPVRP